MDWESIVSMETNASADLAMRVKALEADVQRHNQRIVTLTEKVNELLADVDNLRHRMIRVERP
jgi:uncharacterized protein YoxC